MSVPASLPSSGSSLRELTDVKPLVFVALDFPDAKTAGSMAERLKHVNPYFKVGLELFVAEGPAFVEKLVAGGCQVFLDLKFHDIPNTAAGAVRSAIRTRAGWINVHCGGGSQMMRAAKEAASEEARRLGIPAPKVLGVTVLTSMKDEDLHEIGMLRSAAAQVKSFVELAQNAGLDGVVCSSQELPLVRSTAGPEFVTMVPGIRPAGSDVGDQKRVMTPQEAAKLGADCLVIGRPITKAPDPEKALREVLASL